MAYTGRVKQVEAAIAEEIVRSEVADAETVVELDLPHFSAPEQLLSFIPGCQGERVHTQNPYPTSANPPSSDTPA